MAQNNNRSDQKSDETTLTNGNAITRNLIGLVIISISGVILILLIVFNWCIIDSKDGQLTHAKELVAILLPVIGTWVGTVLAFYFTKENFEAANRSVNTLINKVLSPTDKLSEMKVSEIMIKTELFPLKTFSDYDAYTKCKIVDLVEKMKEDHSERLPILQAKTMKFLFLIYLTTLERFLLGISQGTIKLKGNINIELAKLTIQDMFDSDYQKAKQILELTEKQPLLPITASLGKAIKIMQDNNLCNDVFITKTGSKDEMVEGWITSDLIIEKSELFKKST